MLTNRALSAQEALDWGLVDAVVPDDQLGEESRRLAREFAAGATRAIGTVKKLIDQSWRQAFETQLACEGTGMVAMGRSHDAQEAVAAFVEKRAPRFEGR
jgi:2-(1,2-epoxy-1,2-dihydrophenyl)acetyl-CoA isomerase